MAISTTNLTTTTPEAQAVLSQPTPLPYDRLGRALRERAVGNPTNSLYTSLAQLPRVRRHGKRAWELLRRAKRFVLVDAAGDYYMDRAGNASRPREVSVHVSKLLDPEKRVVRR